MTAELKIITATQSQLPVTSTVTGFAPTRILMQTCRLIGAMALLIAISACSLLSPKPDFDGTGPIATAAPSEPEPEPQMQAPSEEPAAAQPSAEIKPLVRKPARPKRSPPLQSGKYFENDGPGLTPPTNLEHSPDPTPKVETLAAWANRPYTLLGKKYVPERQIKAFRQSGIASWYGRKFHGHKTAIGERYDMYAMTAAHPTLPLPSYVKVTNAKTGASVVVRVNDRGPFLSNRVIDLSYTAAVKLGYADAGHTEVIVEQIAFSDTDTSSMPDQMAATDAKARTAEKDTRTPAATAIQAIAARQPSQVRQVSQVKGSQQNALSESSSTIELPESSPSAAHGLSQAISATESNPALYVQMAAFLNADNARWALSYLQEHLLDSVGAPFTLSEYGGWYRVHAGPFASRSEAARARKKIAQLTGFTPIIALRAAAQ